MRSTFLLALILPYTLANPLQEQDRPHQDFEGVAGEVRRTGMFPGARQIAGANRAGSATYRVARRKEGRSELDAFPQLHHTDCHSGVAARMNDRCGVKGTGQTGTAVMSEGERSDVAISLTICSMASALQPIPTECHLWTTSAAGTKAKSGGRHWLWGPEKGEGNVKTSRAMCLSALHRSPQDWTAYNNYLSDALQLCHALRSQHSEETAQQLYRNATQSQLELLRFIQSTAEGREARDAQTAEMTTSQLLKSEQAVSHISQLISQLQQGSRDASTAIHEVRSALSGFEASGAGIWKDVQEDSLRRSEDMFMRMAAGLEDVKGVFAQELAFELRNVALQHSETLHAHNHRVGEELGLTLASAKGGVELLIMQIAERLRDNDLALQQWGATMSLARLNLAGLADDAHGLVPILRESANSALAIQDAHESLAKSMKDTDLVSEAVTRNLVAALSEINSTMSEVEAWHSKASAPQGWSMLRPGFSLFSSPALLASPTLNTLFSPTGLKALGITADVAVGAIVQIITLLVSAMAFVWAFLWLLTRKAFAPLVKRFKDTLSRVMDSSEDVKITSAPPRPPVTPSMRYERLPSAAPPAYTSPERPITRAYVANALALNFDVKSMKEEDKAQVKETMLRRSYGNLQQAERRGRRTVSAPPM